MPSVQPPKRKRGRPRLGQEPSTAVSLRLDQASVAKLREIAEAQEVGPTTLLRQWVLEQIQASEERKGETSGGRMNIREDPSR